MSTQVGDTFFCWTFGLGTQQNLLPGGYPLSGPIPTWQQRLPGVFTADSQLNSFWMPDLNASVPDSGNNKWLISHRAQVTFPSFSSHNHSRKDLMDSGFCRWDQRLFWRITFWLIIFKWLCGITKVLLKWRRNEPRDEDHQPLRPLSGQ